MPISRGSRLGPYEVAAPLGVGGMGEVHRALDTRLGRPVAIKVLPSEVSSDPVRLARFETEARAASALNHPNIVTIHEVGRAEGLSYIVMELVDGKTLRELLASGALPARKLLPLAAQAASGLAKAHEAGILHRDLKPENLMVTGDGVVKILDFGLAKLPLPLDSGAETAPHAPATRPGTVLGTVGYMSPEQASGKALDFRSDQFSLGAILYEMATGSRAFLRATAAQTLAAIIQDEPARIASLNPKAPPSLRWIVERCLAKDPEERYASTLDLARDLAAARDRLSEAESAPDTPARPRPRQLRWLLALAGATALGVGMVAGWLAWPVNGWQNPLIGARFTRFTDWEGSEVDAAISADGKMVAFVAERDETYDLWVGQVGGGEYLNLTKGRHPDLQALTLGVTGFTHDASHVLFSTPASGGLSQGLQIVPTLGGATRPILPGAVEAAWSPDGQRILYHTADPGDPVFIADRGGANRRQILADQPGKHNHFPAWSPDGRFAYLVRGVPPRDMDVWRIPAAGGEPERLTFHQASVSYPTLLDDRTLLYIAPRADGSGSGLFVMDVEERVAHAASFGLEEYLSVASTADGKRLAAAIANPLRSLWTIPISDRVVEDSGVARFSLPSVRVRAPRFGPGYVSYLSSRSGAEGLWKSQDGVETELWKGSDGAVVAAPAVAPGGDRLAFVVSSGTQGRLHLIASDGTGARRIAEALDVLDAPSWSPDGKWLAVAVKEGQTHPLYKVSVDGAAPVLLVDGKDAVILDPVWSPDGSFIAYSEGRGTAQLRIRAVTPDGRPFPLPEVWVPQSGNRYRFLPDGKGLIVMRGSLGRQDFWLLDLASGGLRRLTDLRTRFEMRSFDVSPDGKRILFDRVRRNSDIVLIDLAR